MKDYEDAVKNQKAYHEYKNKKKKMNPALDYLITLLIAVGIGLLINFVFIVNARIPSGSMETTIMTGDRVFGNRLAYKFSEPERYDIVIFRFPDNESKLFIKRLIGLPGETVVISEGKVYVYDPSVDTASVSDDALIDDPYLLGTPELLDDSFCHEVPEGGMYDGVFRVPVDHYFMLGDNRNHSNDSRFWKEKYVASDKILGKAVFKYWPLNEMKTLGYKGEG